MKTAHKFLYVFSVILLITALIGPSAVPVQARAFRVQPQLLQLAAQLPDQMVAVIVQKAGQGAAPEGWVAKLGGYVTQNLRIINGFAATLPAQAVLDLAAQPEVRWVSLDAPVVKSGGPDGKIDSRALVNVYDSVIGATKIWAQGYQGSDVTVAVVDSGIVIKDDFRSNAKNYRPGDYRLLARVGFGGNEDNLGDRYGHGTHVAGIIAGNGHASKGKYIGVAPKVDLVSVKVSDGEGQGTTSGIVAGLQWVLDNHEAYNIRVVNLSLNSTVDESYMTNPLDAALEILWFNGIVVVVSAGNNGSSHNGVIYPPANDPFVITVGASDDRGTLNIADDTLAKFSAYGTTIDGISKPDIIAPGTNIIAPLSNINTYLAVTHPDHVVGGKSAYYFSMSGTSMSAAVASGAVALLLQKSPNLTPDQVKARLMATGRPFDAGNGAKYLNVYAAATSTSMDSANTGQTVSGLLTTGTDPVDSSVSWNSVSWNSVSWNSVSWNSVSWNSVSWNSVSWNSDYWEP